jgi:short-subunit dehydrogenase
MRIDGAVVLVTGASSGIGASTARRLRAAGAKLVLQGRDPERLAAVAAETGGTVVSGDLSDSAGARAVARRAVEVFERIDVLVSNAGVGWCGPLSEMTGADVTRVIGVNLLGPVELTRELLPGMRARGRGRLVYVSSIAGRTGVAEEAVYAASKAGLDAFAESVRFELAGTGLGVSVVVPGVVDTPFFARRGRPYARTRPRPIPADAVAATIERAIITGRAERYVPRWLAVPAALRVAAPAVYRVLAGRFGGS